MIKVEAYRQNKNRMVEKFVASFLSGLFAYQIQKTGQDDTSVVATPATMSAPVLSTLFEISGWPIHCYGPMIGTLLNIYVLNLIFC
jgi:hypothetical protein